MTDLCATPKRLSWKWIKKNFDKIKEIPSADTNLIQSCYILGLDYNATSSIVLFHSYPDRPITYASKSLTPAEQHYSLIK